MSDFRVIVTADCCAADYVTKESRLTAGEVEDYVRPVVAILRTGQNWNISQMPGPGPQDMYEGIVTEEQLRGFDELVPYGEYGVHSIDKVEITPWVDSTVLYPVEERA